MRLYAIRDDQLTAGVAVNVDLGGLTLGLADEGAGTFTLAPDDEALDRDPDTYPFLVVDYSAR